MSIRLLKDGNRCVETTYEVRLINEHGDAEDVWTYDTLFEAKRAYERACDHGNAAAVVLEQHIVRSPAHRFIEPTKYRLLRWTGSREAFAKWNGSEE